MMNRIRMRVERGRTWLGLTGLALCACSPQALRPVPSTGSAPEKASETALSGEDTLEKPAHPKATALCPPDMVFVEGGRLAPVGRKFPKRMINGSTGAVERVLEPDPEYVASFCMDRHMVRLEDYARCVAQGACKRIPCMADGTTLEIECDHDVELEGFVAHAWIWHARSYCRHEGKRLAHYRQWDYAAHGVDSRRYPWGGEVRHAGDGQECSSFGGIVRQPCNWKGAPRDITPFGVEDLASWSEITDGQGRFICPRTAGFHMHAGRAPEFVRGAFRCTWTDFPPGHPGNAEPGDRQLFRSPKGSGAARAGDGKVADAAKPKQIASEAQVTETAKPEQAKQPAGKAEQKKDERDARDAAAREARCPPEMAFLQGGELERMDGTKVTVAPFCMDRYEVSREHYMRCMSEGNCTAIPCVGRPDTPGDFPVECAHWSQARDYCAAMDKRLPNSAEWYFAAGGFDGRRFPWGDGRADPEEKDQVCFWRRHRGPCPIGQSPKDRTPHGIYDLAASAQEWSADDAPIAGRKYLHGGASYVHFDWLLGNQFTLGVEPDATYAGFRCARSVRK